MSSRPGIGSLSSYAILGCGSVGHAVAEELVERGKQVLLIDNDPDRVESLRDQDLNAQQADIRDADIAELVADHDAVLILASDVEANEAAVRTIRSHDSEQFLVVRATDPVTSDELSTLGADVVVNPSAVIADAALRALEAGELEYRAEQLADIIEATVDRLAIVTHDNPDPDSIASAAALRSIAEYLGVEADILYFGEIGRQENRAFVNILGLELHEYDSVNIDDYDTVALVDHAKAGAIATDPVDFDVDVYIDHFEPEGIEEYAARFVDIRTNVSATSTILTKYVQEFDIGLDPRIATALLYGIRAETLDFRRDTTPADLTAAAYLYPFADHDTLEQVESPTMSPETLDVLAEAISNREVQGSHLITNAGYIRDRDALAQAAQQLLNLEGVTTTAVFGIVDETIHLAARSKDIRVDIGSVLAEAFGDVGATAGHATQASVEIPLGIFSGLESVGDNRETLLALAGNAVTRKLFDEMGVESDSGNGTA